MSTPAYKTELSFEYQGHSARGAVIAAAISGARRAALWSRRRGAAWWRVDVRRRFLFGLLAFLATGCGDRLATFEPRDYVCASDSAPCATTEPVRSAAQRTVAIRIDREPSRIAYVVSWLSVPVGGHAAGFNLDRMDSGDGSGAASCEQYQADAASANEPTHPGVDNQIAQVVPTIEGLREPEECPSGMTEGCFDAMLARSIETGDTRVIVVIDELDSFENDLDVRVSLHESQAPLDIDAAGRPQASQRVELGRSLAPPTRGDVFEGRLRVVFDAVELPLELLVPGARFDLFPPPLYTVEMRADLAPGAMGSGALGGGIGVDELVDVTPPVALGTTRGAIESIADLRPDPGTAICAQISFGFAFEAVAVRP